MSPSQSEKSTQDPTCSCFCKDVPAFPRKSPRQRPLATTVLLTLNLFALLLILGTRIQSPFESASDLHLMDVAPTHQGEAGVSSATQDWLTVPSTATSGRRLMQAVGWKSSANRAFKGGSKDEEIEHLRMQAASMSARLLDLKNAFSKAVEERSLLELKLKRRRRVESCGDKATEGTLKDVMAATGTTGESKGMFVLNEDGTVKSWKGYQCTASEEEIELYLSYTPGALCPDDWFFVQFLIYMKGCHALPKRNCFARTPQNPVKPLPFPKSLFDQRALASENVRWDLHWCKSFDCLNNRTEGGDCLNCFNMKLESHRWQKLFRGSPPIDDVIKMARIPLRLGLDVGGGTGTFAAHLARRNATVVTTAFNIETLPGRETHGLPFMETIALRGLVPLHMPHQARLPFFDGTFDFVHCMNSVKFMSIYEFEVMLFDWDRILRPGGIMWFELLYAPDKSLKKYIFHIERFGYRKLYWNLTPKPQEAIGWREPMTYLSCILEKQPRKDSKYAS